MMIIWEVWCNSDAIEGRGRPVLDSRWRHEADAIEAARSLGPMGASDGKVRSAPVFATSYERDEWEQGEVKRRALAKLTSEERQALGL